MGGHASAVLLLMEIKSLTKTACMAVQKISIAKRGIANISLEEKTKVTNNNRD